jgi:putative endopeptidase
MKHVYTLSLGAALIAAASLVSCSSSSTVTKPTPDTTPTDTPAAAASPRAPFAVPATFAAGLDAAIVDAKTHPCDDFYRFACGGWLDKTEIPADRSTYSRGFLTLNDRNELLQKEMLEAAAAGKLDGVDKALAKKVGDHYGTCMDEAALEKALPSLKKELAFLNGKPNAKTMPKLVGELHKRGVGVFFGFGSLQDLDDSSKVIVGVGEGGLGLPERDYYVNDADPKMKEIRGMYIEHIRDVFVLLGDKPDVAAKKATDIMVLETRLAKATLTNVEHRDPLKLKHPMTLAELQKLTPSFDWAAYLKAVGASKDAAAKLNVSHIPFVEEVHKVMLETAPETITAYATFHAVGAATPALPKAFQTEAFTFASKAFTGQKEDEPRWKKCIAFTDSQLGEILGQVFVAKHFGKEGKEKTLAMVKALEETFDKNLKSLAWMDDKTREVAYKKIRSMRNMIGYPDKWRDYSKYKVESKGFLGNLLRGVQEQNRRDLAKVGKPVDKDEWFMTPTTVNAYNDPQNNQIVFPAGILQPPFFNNAATDAVNFGAMGMVVGHEITHGFDDEGAKFDDSGTVRNWWSEASAKVFAEKTGCVKEQYDNYIAIDDVKLKGDLTLGENVADLGGLKVSLLALQEWLGSHPAPENALSTTQQFYLSYAQSWCSKYRPEQARSRAANDPHSPPMWRVNGPLSNLPSFAEAFGCKAGDKMVRQKRCDVW